MIGDFSEITDHNEKEEGRRCVDSSFAIETDAKGLWYVGVFIYLCWSFHLLGMCYSV